MNVWYSHVWHVAVATWLCLNTLQRVNRIGHRIHWGGRNPGLGSWLGDMWGRKRNGMLWNKFLVCLCIMRYKLVITCVENKFAWSVLNSKTEVAERYRIEKLQIAESFYKFKTNDSNSSILLKKIKLACNDWVTGESEKVKLTADSITFFYQFFLPNRTRVRRLKLDINISSLIYVAGYFMLNLS